jgi:xanthine dehydrogenase/oxidase
MNPAIDIGQIEGGFIQGYGLLTMEELVFGPDGEILTIGPFTYKIPTSRDIPKQFNVTLLKGTGDPKALYSSKVLLNVIQL